MAWMYRFIKKLLYLGKLKWNCGADRGQRGSQRAVPQDTTQVPTSSAGMDDLPSANSQSPGVPQSAEHGEAYTNTQPTRALVLSIRPGLADFPDRPRARGRLP